MGSVVNTSETSRMMSKGAGGWGLLAVVDGVLVVVIDFPGRGTQEVPDR